MQIKTETAVVRHGRDVRAEEVKAGENTSLQVLIGVEDGAPNFAMRRFTMGDGGGIPLHTNRVEHEQYVLAGRARIEIGDRVYEVVAEDVLLIPAGVPHSCQVLEAPFEFLCLVPNSPDQIEFTEPSSC